MWIFGSDYFVSVVEARDRPDHLWVRGRATGDISRFLTGKVEEIETPTADYRFRYLATRKLVQMALSIYVEKLAYTNFKDSVKVDDRHDAYLGVWGEMNAFQRKRHPAKARVAAGLELQTGDDFHEDDPSSNRWYWRQDGTTILEPAKAKLKTRAKRRRKT